MSVAGSAEQKKRPLRLPSLDPILSEPSLPLPGIEYQPVGATRFRSATPIAPTGDWLPPAGPGCLEQRTNLLSPSVAHLPVFKVRQITATIFTLPNARSAVNNFFEIFSRPAARAGGSSQSLAPVDRPVRIPIDGGRRSRPRRNARSHSGLQADAAAFARRRARRHRAAPVHSVYQIVDRGYHTPCRRGKADGGRLGRAAGGPIRTCHSRGRGRERKRAVEARLSLGYDTASALARLWSWTEDYPGNHKPSSPGGPMRGRSSVG